MKLEASDRLRLVRLFAADIATPSQIETIDEQMAASARVLPMRRSVAYSVQPEGGLLRFVISDERVNRYGDIVRQDGWKLENFRRNPIALWGHDYDQPIGTWTDIRTEMLDGGKVTTGAVRLASEASEDIARIDRLARADVLRAVSPGFLNLKSRKPANDEERGRLGLGKYGVELLENELHEISLVSVGAQPGALKMSVEAGHITAADAEYIERVTSRQPTPSTSSDRARRPSARSCARTSEISRCPRRCGSARLKARSPRAWTRRAQS